MLPRSIKGLRDYAVALTLGASLIEAAEHEGDPANLAMAENDHAITLQAQGWYAAAEGLLRKAPEIDSKTIGAAQGHLDTLPDG